MLGNKVQKTEKIRKILTGLFGWTLSIILIIGMLKTVPIKSVWIALRQVNPLFILFAMFFSLINLWLRGGRWALLFRPHYQVSSKSASSLILIGLAINAVMPGRVGELARIGLGVKKFKSTIAFTAATVVVERLFDGITLLTLLGLSLLYLPKILTNQSAQLMGQVVSGDTLTDLLRGIALICVLFAVFVIGLAIPRGRRLIVQLVSSIPGIGKWIKRKSEHTIEDIGRGLYAFHKPGTILLLFIYSFCIWLALVLCNLCVSYGMVGIKLTLLQAVVVTSVSIAVSSIPSAPGAWGVFEAGALLSLMALNVNYNQAVGVAYVLIIHLCGYLPVVLLGAISASSEHVMIRNLQNISRPSERQ